jgi:hypothetical protein
MHKLTILSVIVSCGLLAMGCSSSTSGGGTFSCDQSETVGTTTVHSCAEYTNLPDADQTSVSDSCTAGMGTAGTGCPTTDSLGSCALKLDTIDYSTFYYSDGGETADDASTSCTDAGGTWMAGG